MESNQVFWEIGDIRAIIKSYRGHPRIRQIKDMRNSSNSEINKGFCFNLVTTKEIKQLRQSLNAKKAVGIDLVPPKLVKLADIPFYKPLTETINFCIQHGIYPDSAKVALAVHLNTEKAKKKSKFQILDLLLH